MAIVEKKDSDIMQFMLGVKGDSSAVVLFEIGLDGEPEVMCAMADEDRVGMIDMLEDLLYALEIHQPSALN